MSDYLNNLLARSFAAPAHHDGLVVPRRWNEYEAPELPQTPAESSQDGELDRWSEHKESPLPKEVGELSPANSYVSAVTNNEIANRTALSLPGIAPPGEATPLKQFADKSARNVLPLPTETKVTRLDARREIPLSVLPTMPHLESRQMIPLFVEREVLVPPPASPIPQMVKAKSPEAPIQIKADPPPRNAQVNEKPTAVRTPPPSDESAIRPLIAPSIIMSAANQAKTAAPVETVINVTIGRVEVRATPTPATPVRKQPSVAPTMSLDDYLHRRNGGRG